MGGRTGEYCRSGLREARRYDALALLAGDEAAPLLPPRRRRRRRRRIAQSVVSITASTVRLATAPPRAAGRRPAGAAPRLRSLRYTPYSP